MKNQEGLVSHTHQAEKREPITVCLQPLAIRRLDELAARSERSRSQLIALLLDAALLAILAADPPRL